MGLQYLTVPSSPISNHTSTCFILHGLGDSGSGWRSVAQILSRKLPMTKFILPHARNKPVTLNRGYSMPAWYDIYDLHEGAKQDKAGILQSVKEILELVAEEERKGISRDKIVIGGFSQGGAISLATGLLFKSIPGNEEKDPFAGILALSTYLPIQEYFEEKKALIPAQTPIYMCHGTDDQVIDYTWARKSKTVMKDNLECSNVKFETMPEVGHSIDENSIESIAKFLKKVFNYQ